MNFIVHLPCFLLFLPLAFTTVHYGRCPILNGTNYPDKNIQSFEGEFAKVVYFSNVRFERLFEKPPLQEMYKSNYVIQLRQSDNPDELCYYPFRLLRRPVSRSNDSSRGGRDTLINTRVVDIRDSEGYLFAFSCAEMGNRKLEFVWVVRRNDAARKSLSDIKETFGKWFELTATKVTNLINMHHQLPFCGGGGLLTVVYWIVGVVVGALAVAATVVFWRKQCRSTKMKSVPDVAADGEHDFKKDTEDCTSIGVV